MSTLIRLIVGDCIEQMARLPEASVDMVFADPPYHLSNGGTTCQSGERVRVYKGDWDHSRGLLADVEFHMRWLRACRRVMKPDGTLWVSGTLHSIYVCGYLLQVLGFHLLNDICWFKPNASPNLACRTFTHSHETLLWCRREREQRHRFNYRDMKYGVFAADLLKAADKQMRSVWRIPTTPPSERCFGRHPTQKPVALLERVVLSSTQQGDMVLDPFLGSGTTGVVCAQHGRNFIGIERDCGYVKIAARRIDPSRRRSARPEGVRVA